MFGFTCYILLTDDCQSVEKMTDSEVDISQVTGAPIRYTRRPVDHHHHLHHVEPAGVHQHHLHHMEPAMIHQQQVHEVECGQYNTTYYYNTLPSQHPQQLYIPPVTPQYGLLPQETPQYGLSSPSVQFVPYYYYYPVPDSVPPLTTHNTQQTPPTKLVSSSSCDSSIKVIRRRKKKKRIQEKDEAEAQFQDIDSGYFNGPDSSEEMSSENELSTDRGKVFNVSGSQAVSSISKPRLTLVFVDEDVGISLEAKGDPKGEGADTGNVTIDFEFGDVQEILDELSKDPPESEAETDNANAKSEDRIEQDTEAVEESREETEDREVTLEGASHRAQEGKEKQKKIKKSKKKSSKNVSSQSSENKETSLLSGKLILNPEVSSPDVRAVNSLKAIFVTSF